MDFSIERADSTFVSRLRAWRTAFLAFAALMLMHGIVRAQCDSNPDFIVLPDGSGTPEILFVINNEVTGVGGDGIGTVIVGTFDGGVSQKQTLRIVAPGRVVPNNGAADPSCGVENTAGVFIEKTGIVDMQGGSLEPITFTIAGPTSGDAASGGILQGFGTVKAVGGLQSGNYFPAFELIKAVINPTGGVLNLQTSDQILINNSTLRVPIAASTTSYLNIVSGDLTFTNTKLAVDFPVGFSAASGQEFTLVKFSGGTRTGLLKDASGVDIQEGDTVTVNGVNLKLSYVGGASGKDIVLKKEPLPIISLKTPPAINEGSAATPGLTIFNLSLNVASSQPVTVNFATANGTAISGSDYTAKTGTLTFAAGETSKSVPVNFIGDSIFEANETFVLNLSSPTNATIDVAQATGTITNDDVVPSLSINDVAVSEGQNGTTTATFNVTLSSVCGQTVTVQYSTADGTANPAIAKTDYAPVALTTLTFAPGETTKTIGITINGDTLDEADETFFVNLTSPSNATIADAQSLGTITDDDTAPTLVVSDPVSQKEGSAAAPGSATFTVTLSAASGKTVTVNYNTTNGVANGALAGSDYVAKSGSLTFAPGETSKFVKIFFIGDAVAELNEPFFFDIKTPSNATIADSRGSTYIKNDDGPGMSIANALTVDEGNSGTKAQTFTVTLSAASTNTVTVNYTTANGTAGPADYTVQSGVLTFAPGETSKVITVLVKGDTTVEPTETYKVNLVSPTYAILTDSQGSAYIRNDDAAPLLFEDAPSE